MLPRLAIRGNAFSVDTSVWMPVASKEDDLSTDTGLLSVREINNYIQQTQKE